MKPHKNTHPLTTFSPQYCINGEQLPSTRKSDNNNMVHNGIHAIYRTAIATCSRRCRCCCCWWTCWAGVKHEAVSQCEGQAPQPARQALPGRSGPHTPTATTPHTPLPGEKQYDLLSNVTLDAYSATTTCKLGAWKICASMPLTHSLTYSSYDLR